MPPTKVSPPTAPAPPSPLLFYTPPFPIHFPRLRSFPFVLFPLDVCALSLDHPFSPTIFPLHHITSLPPILSLKHQRPLGGSFHSTPQAAGLAPQFATNAPMASPTSGKTAFGHSSSSSLGVGGGSHSSHSSGGGNNHSHVRSQTSSLEAPPNAVEAALREVNQKFKAGEASRPSKEVR